MIKKHKINADNTRPTNVQSYFLRKDYQSDGFSFKRLINAHVLCNPVITKHD